MSRRPVRVLTIAGSDSGGGAGIQADLKTIAAHGAYGASAITALTAQNTLGVHGVLPVPPEFVAAQIDAVLEDIGADAIKTGMLANAGVVAVVAERLAAYAGPPVVVDPVLVAASGDPLLAPDAIAVLRERLLPLARLVTPNLPEAERLVGTPAATLAERGELARALGRAGASAVLLKGAHAPGATIVDLLWDGRELVPFAHPRLETHADHGTGCTLSAAIASRLGGGAALGAACGGAIEWLQEALRHAPAIGGGHGPVDHQWQQAARP